MYIEMYIETNKTHASVIGWKEGMMTFLIILLIMTVVLDTTAIQWGADSRDGINSLEWIRRQQWYGFH
jgi:hypothetical protein